MKNENKSRFWSGRKIALMVVAVLIVLIVVGVNLLPALQTMGASFGYGYPSGKGGRAIRDVEIDVEPQVVYRIDDHRFFTFEKYLDCNSGGFVYYNDTKRGIKKFAGIEGQDKNPQDEVSVMQKNNVLAYNGKFIYAASDDVIAYPDRNVNYKYGGATYFVDFSSIKDQSKRAIVKTSSSLSNTLYILDSAIYIQKSRHDTKYEKYQIPKKNNQYEWVDTSDLHLDFVSQDERFHCDDTIRPKRVKYLKN